MARQRLPHVSAWLQIVFRLVSLVACHGCLLTCIYILYTFHTSNALIYLAILWTLVIDNAEILALYTKPGDGIWRFRLWPLVAWEAVGILLFLGSAFLSFHGDKSKHKDGESEARINYETAKWSLIFLIMGLHIILIVVCGIDSSLHRRRRAQQVERTWLGSMY